MTITYRATKGSALLYGELDENFRDLYQNTDIQRVLTNGNVSNLVMTINTLNANTLNANTLNTNNLNVSVITLGGSTGTAGQLLTSNGAGNPPYWQTPSTVINGLLIRAPRILTTGTTYTSPNNCTTIYVEAVGGGGGGGGTDGTSTTAQAAGGGGSGGYCAKYFTVTPNTNYSYTIGTGGTGGTGAGGVAGSNGSATTFTVNTVTITANGGVGGGPGQSEIAPGYAGDGGNALNGDLNVNGSPGGAGHSGWANSSQDLRLSGGHGGSSFFGGGGKGSRSGSSDDTVGTNGGGGGGAASDLTGTSTTGSNGGNGMIRIWEYT